MRDIGTLEMRVGFNQTQFANDSDGGMSAQGLYRMYQHNNKLIMLARPQADAIAKQAAEEKFGQKKVAPQQIHSVQCSAALFNFQQSKATWEIFVDAAKVEALPAMAKYGQVITIHDGVSYLALRPLPTDDVGRDIEIGLEAGQPQAEAYHDGVNVQAALLINAYLYKRPTEISAEAKKKLQGTQTGFVVEMGDAAEYGSFEKFQAHIRSTAVNAGKDVTYKSGSDTLVANWDTFTVNGADPYAYLKEKELWQDTPVSQMGKQRLEKNGAVVERQKSGASMFLHAFPKQKLYVATNPLPNYQAYTFQEPGGVRIIADGVCSMGYWAVKDSRAIDIRYHGFEGQYAPKSPAAACLFVTGVKTKPQVTLNQRDISDYVKPWARQGAAGWLIPLGAQLPPDDQINARLDAAANL
jgi:hypothetical protein